MTNERKHTPDPDRSARVFAGKRASELAELFQSLIENAFDVIEVIDTDSTTLYVSASCTGVLGYKPDELIGTRDMRIIHPDDRELARGVIDEVTRNPGQSSFVQLRVYRKDGSLGVFELAAKTLPSPPFVDEIVLNYHDVTEKRATEDALRRSEERFYKAFHSCPSSITISRLEDGVFVEANDGFEKLSGYKRDEIVGKTSMELRLWEDPAQRDTIVERLRTAGTVRNYKTEFRTKNGDTRICRFSADVIEIEDDMFTLAVTSDITDWVRAESQLRQTARELRSEREELARKNIALKHVLEHLEKEKADYRHEISAKVENLFGPAVEKLKASGGHLAPADVQRLDEALRSIIEEDLRSFENNLARLSPRELDVCQLIKEGLSSKEMADRLGLSIQTVHKHRRAIRRKLELTNKDINLAAFLRSKDRSI
jgi:PAS domain S-box-containing protein